MSLLANVLKENMSHLFTNIASMICWIVLADTITVNTIVHTTIYVAHQANIPFCLQSPILVGVGMKKSHGLTRNATM